MNLLRLTFFFYFQMFVYFLTYLKTILEKDEDQYVCDVHLFRRNSSKLKENPLKTVSNMLK